MPGDTDNLPTDLTPNEQAELDADTAERAAGAAPAAAAAASDTTAADAAAAQKAIDDAAAAAAKPDPVAEANAKTAEQLARAADALVALATPKAAETTTTEAAPITEATFDAERSAVQTKFDTAVTDLDEKLDKGEIDQGERDRLFKQADAERERTREDILERKADWKAETRISARLAAERETAVQGTWESTWRAFANDEVNKAFLGDPIRKAAYEAVLQAVGKESPTMPFADMMATARDRTAAAFSMKIGGDATATDAAKIAAAQRERDKKTGDIPRSPAAAPSAGIPGSATTESDLDAMPIDDLENTLARMTPAQQAAYLASAAGSKETT